MLVVCCDGVLEPDVVRGLAKNLPNSNLSKEVIAGGGTEQEQAQLVMASVVLPKLNCCKNTGKTLNLADELGKTSVRCGSGDNVSVIIVDISGRD